MVKIQGEAMTELTVGHTEDGHSYIGGDPGNPNSWKQQGAIEDGHVFRGGDPGKAESWSSIASDTNSPQTSVGEATISGFGQGATLGYLPQIQAIAEPYVQSVLNKFLPENPRGFNIQEAQPKTYLQLRDEAISQQDEYKKEHPGATIAGQLSGGLATGIASGGLIGSGARATTFGGRAAQAAKTGAAFGAVSNPGDTTGTISPLQPMQRLGGAALGGIAGAAIQGGLEGIGSLGLKGLQKSGIISQGNPIAEKAAQLTATIQQERPIVQDELNLLSRIAKEQNLPLPTLAQARQGKAILAEKNLMDVPFYGEKIRKAADEQVAAVRKNLEREVGDFINAPTHPGVIGEMTKNLGEANVGMQKQIASNLYDQVDVLGKNATIGKKVFFNKFRDFAGEHGLINPDLSQADYAADTGLTRNEFETLQTLVFDGMNAIKKSASPKIPFNSINALRKTLSNASESLSDSNPNTARILNSFISDLKTSAQSSLDRESPTLGSVFKEANKRYAEYKDIQDTFKKLIGEKVSAEDVMKKIMSSTNNIEKMKKLVGGEKMKEIGMAHINDILATVLPKSGEARADSARFAMKKIQSEAESAIGKDSFKNIVDNLYYLSKTKEPIVISRESASNLWALAGGIGNVAKHTIHVAKNIKEAGVLPTKSTSSVNPSISGMLGGAAPRVLGGSK